MFNIQFAVYLSYYNSMLMRRIVSLMLFPKSKLAYLLLEYPTLTLRYFLFSGFFYTYLNYSLEWKHLDMLLNILSYQPVMIWHLVEQKKGGEIVVHTMYLHKRSTKCHNETKSIVIFFRGDWLLINRQRKVCQHIILLLIRPQKRSFMFYSHDWFDWQWR
jgi:hypothetical protein